MESETEEERLKTEHFILNQAHANLKQKWRDVVEKNKRWGEKDEISRKQKAALTAELARLESRNIKTLQELKDTTLEVATVRARNTELEALCHKQSEEVYAEKTRFDDYIQAVAHLTSQFVGRPSDPTTYGPPFRPSRSGEGGHRSHTENSRCADDTYLLAQMPGLDQDVLSTVSQQLQGDEAKITESPLSSRIQLEHGGDRGNDISESTDKTALSWVPRTYRRSTPSVSDRLQGEQYLSKTKKSEQRPPRHDSKTPEHTRKRGRLPDEDLGHLVEKRRRHEHSRQATQSAGQASDPRLRLRWV